MYKLSIFLGAAIACSTILAAPVTGQEQRITNTSCGNQTLDVNALPYTFDDVLSICKMENSLNQKFKVNGKDVAFKYLGKDEKIALLNETPQQPHILDTLSMDAAINPQEYNPRFYTFKDCHGNEFNIKTVPEVLKKDKDTVACFTRGILETKFDVNGQIKNVTQMTPEEQKTLMKSKFPNFQAVLALDLKNEADKLDNAP